MISQASITPGDAYKNACVFGAQGLRLRGEEVLTIKLPTPLHRFNNAGSGHKALVCSASGSSTSDNGTF
jgi:hypothetical protein